MTELRGFAAGSGGEAAVDWYCGESWGHVVPSVCLTNVTHWFPTNDTAAAPLLLSTAKTKALNKHLTSCRRFN